MIFLIGICIQWMRVSPPGWKVHGRMHLCPTTQTVDSVKQQMKKHRQPSDLIFDSVVWRCGIWNVSSMQAGSTRFLRWAVQVSVSFAATFYSFLAQKQKCFSFKTRISSGEYCGGWVWRCLPCCVWASGASRLLTLLMFHRWSGAYLLIPAKVRSH